jgi:transcriptional regulator with XRE-family HTH domain/tetratricopeptide (TPR) repeat protein
MAERAVPAFGALLRRYRLAAGLTQEELAERARMSARAISDLERGLARRPRKETVQLLADALRLAGQEQAALAAARGVDEPPLAPSAEPGRASAGTPALVGRTRELALLERHLAGEGPPLLVVAGEPGIGKSRLLREAARRAAERGMQVVADGCQRRGGQEPYAPLLGAIKRCIAARQSERLRSDLRGCAWLVRLLPELASGPIEPLPAWTLPPEQQRRLLFEAAGRFLANVAGPSGTLLVLDDLQWAGPDALDLLATLVRGAGESPLRVVAAYRDTEAATGDPLLVLLADLTHAELATRCPLGPLGADEARQLLAGLLTAAEAREPALQDELLQRVGGVPFFLISYVRALDPSVPAHRQERIPWSLAQSVRQRVASLPAPAAEVLAVAALIGRTVPPDLLLRVSAQQEEAVYAVLDAAQRARLLQVEGREYQFTHDLIREVLEEDVGAARRAALHRRIAGALEQDAGDPPLEALAYHFDRGGDRERAAHYLELAGDRAQERQAQDAAEASYREAAEHLELLGSVADLARVRLKLGTVLFAQARYEAALAALEPAAATFHQAGDWEGLARTLAQIGAVHSNWGTFVEGLARLRAWMEVLEASGPTSGLAAMFAVMADLHSMCVQPNEAVAAAERAVAIAQAVGDDRVLADAQTYRGYALTFLDRYAEARAVLVEAIRLGEATGAWATLPFALEAMAHVAFHAGEFTACRHPIDRAVEIAARRGDPFQLVAFLHVRGLLAFWRGDWLEARDDLTRSLALCRQAGTLAISAHPPLCLARLCLATGEWAEGAGLIAESMALPDRDTHPVERDLAQGLLAQLDLLEGRPDAARTRILSLSPAVYHDGFFEEVVPHGYGSLLALASLELGEMAEAERVVSETIAYARATQSQPGLVEALWAAARVALRQGRGTDAAAYLDEALPLARAMPYPHAEARLLRMYGDLHAIRDEPGPARERWASALAIFRRLGARKDAERTDQQLAAHLHQHE